MTSHELIAELAAAQVDTAWWLALCREAHARAKWGSLHLRHVPASYYPSTWLLPDPSELEAPCATPAT
jgi:hypothetical protein